MLVYTSKAFLVLSIFYIFLALIPSLVQVLLKSLRNARIYTSITLLARAALIFRPIIDATRRLRLRKVAI